MTAWALVSATPGGQDRQQPEHRAAVGDQQDDRDHDRAWCRAACRRCPRTPRRESAALPAGPVRVDRRARPRPYPVMALIASTDVDDLVPAVRVDLDRHDGLQRPGRPAPAPGRRPGRRRPATPRIAAASAAALVGVGRGDAAGALVDDDRRGDVVGLEAACRSATWVASAPPGSQAELSFFSTPVSLPAIGAAIARITTHRPSTTHLLQRPQTSPAIAAPPCRPTCGA